MNYKQIRFAVAGIAIATSLGFSAGASEYSPPISLNNSTAGIEPAGSASVGLSGDASYSYAIPLPTGVNGLTPSLGVNYSSAIRQGLLGYGWELSGVSAINRCKGTYFADGYAGRIAADSRDRLCLNGLKLVHMAGEYGSPSTEYRTLSDTYQKVVLHNGMQESDSWFEVWDTTGVRSEYRQTFATDSGVPLSWHLTRKTDLAGNSITYHYDTTLPGNEAKPMLSRIDYSGFQVNLNYQNKQYPSIAYIAGKVNADRYRVQSINVAKKIDFTSVLNLNFHYSNRSQKDTLNKVTLAKNSKPDITVLNISWLNGEGQPVINYKETKDLLDSKRYKYRYISDVDGDAYPDIIGFSSGVVSVLFGNKKGDYNSITHALSMKVSLFKHYPKSYRDLWNSDYVRFTSPPQVSDVNADGKADAILFCKEGVYVALSNGRSFQKPKLWTNHFTYNTGWYSKHKRVLADVNGDGLNDMVGISKSAVYVSLSDGSKFLTPKKWSSLGWGDVGLVADVNGDNMADIIGIDHSRINVATSDGDNFIYNSGWITQSDFVGEKNFSLAMIGKNKYFSFQLIDINADGLSDFVGFSRSGVEVIFSTGNSFTKNYNWINDKDSYQKEWTRSSLRLFEDINFDGKPDYIALKALNLTTAINAGSHFDTTYRWSWQLKNPDDEKKIFKISDINNDGIGDVLSISDGKIKRAFGQDFAPRVTSITSALGNEIIFDYANLSNSSVYRTSGQAKYPQKNVHTGMVVSKISRSDGIGGYNEVHYKYEGKRTHLMGAGNLGFAKIHKWDKTLNRVESRSFHQEVENTLLYSALKERTLCQLSSGDSFGFDSCDDSAGNKIEHTVNRWQTETAIGAKARFASAGSAYDYTSPFVEHQRYKQQLVNSTSKSWDLQGTLLKTVSVDKTYNKWYGHTLTQTTNTTDEIHNTTHTEKVTYDYKTPDTDNWLVNLLSKKTIERSGSALYADDGVTRFIQTFDFDYNSKGQLIRSYEQKGTELERSIAYSDFDRGLAKTATEYWSPALSKHIQKNGTQVSSRVTRYTFDSFGYISSTTNALGQKTTSVFDPVTGRLTSSTGLDGNTTRYYFDDWGREQGVDTPQGSWQRIVYSASDDSDYHYKRTIYSNTEPETTQWFDSKHRERKSKTAILGGFSYRHKRFDAAGRLIAESVPDKNEGSRTETQYEYDPLSRLERVNKADGSETRYRYSGFTTEVTNSLNQRSMTDINALGQKVNIEDDEGNVISYRYDGWGNLTRTTDKDDNAIRITFNALGYRSKMIDPDLGTLRYKTNGLGQVYEFSNNAGAVTRDYYDLLGRKTKRTDPETPSGKLWQFNSKGQLSSAQQPGYYEGYSYYPNGQLKEKTFSLLSKTYKQTFSYDANGRALKMDYGNNLVTHYQYSDKNILNEVYLSENGSAVKGKLVWSLGEMDAFGNQSKMVLGNGLASQYRYDAVTGRIDTVTLGAHQSGSITPYLSHDFNFDSIGNLTFRQEQVNLNGAFGRAQYHFSRELSEYIIYDNINRISTVNTSISYLPGFAPASGSHSSVSVQYDGLGNITHKSDVGDYHYDSVRPHTVTRLSGKTTANFAYDSNGNQISGMGRTITGYTSFNKPTEIRKGGHTTRFSYGVHQQRYLRTDVNDEGTTTTTYLDSTEIIQQPNGQTIFRYYIGDFAIHEKTVGSLSKSSLRYLHKDHLGSVIAISNEGGEIEQRFSYDAWGKRRETALGMTVSEKGRIGYTGHEMLDEVGLIHMNGRVYDPTLGRFLSADPFIQDEWFGTQAFNRYSYVQNNPLSYTDPTGMLSIGACEPEDTGSNCPPEDNKEDPFENDSKNDSVPDKQKELGKKEEKSFWGSLLDSVNFTLDIIGQVPGIGIGADLLNAGIYLARGQYTNAAISATAAVPIVGNAVSSARIARNAAKIADVKVVDEVMEAVSGVTKKVEIKSVKEQAADLVTLNNNKHRVTLRSPSQKVEIDLAGKTHGDVPTPHTKVSERNLQAPKQPAYNTKNAEVHATTQQEVRMVRKYLERNNR